MIRPTHTPSRPESSAAGLPRYGATWAIAVIVLVGCAPASSPALGAGGGNEHASASGGE